MKYKIKSLNLNQAKDIASWEYQDEYSIYNFGGWERVLEEKWGISNPLIREKEFYSFLDKNDELIGFFRIKETKDKFTLGLGIKPDLCGKKISVYLLKEVIIECNRKSPQKTIELSVRKFNKRAIKAYLNAGFKIKGEHRLNTPLGEGIFVDMILKER